MDKKLFDSIIDKIAVTEPVNDPQAYQFTCQAGELFVPFIDKSDSIKGYVKCDEFDMEESTFCIYDARFIKKTLGILEDNIRLSLVENGDDTDLQLSDTKTSIKIGLTDSTIVTHVQSLDECYMFDDDSWENMIVIDNEFINRFLKVASNESYEEQDTFSIKWNSKKDMFTFNIGKKAKIKFDVDGTNSSSEDVNLLLSVLDIVRIFKANKNLTEGYFYLTNDICRLEFISENIKSVYNLVTQSYAH